MRKYSASDLTLAALIAALYAVMSCFANIFGLTFGAVQFRFSEALTVLPWLFPSAVPGLFLGCLLTNLLSPYGLLDVVLGSAATLIAAVWTRKMPSWQLAPLPPVICNAVLVGFTIAWVEAGGLTAALPAAWVIQGGWIALSEAAVCYALGPALLAALSRVGFLRKQIPEERLAVIKKD